MSVSPFCCSILPELEGKIVVKYSRDGEDYTRFLDDFFGLDPNTQQPRFELVPEREVINRKIESLLVGINPVGVTIDKLARIVDLHGKSEGSGK